ncbi:uncharacterized protein LOC115799910, partial [Scomber scombrus]
SAQFNLLNGADVDLKDSSGVKVEADIFDELLRSAKVSFKVSTELSVREQRTEDRRSVNKDKRKKRRGK